ncbi:type I-E CRISPR-associated protein Cse1/CasA [Frankia sp. CNm7]|uniref:Type I-E CRISPR-associated protein Cse1/CasA n=1 Tax=Frankia nepalensis TaxID=1836974 RepID=A0A937UQJ8_9ACTN|nr:type I-E CRISPR-associated protein Cse1/CasA [Frankia nepalensis]MBL7498290.1 type I-E CRISPR-associated protein Cse1/CasA [Frankia nepalensis]MBL7509118.1 type I-E CRISPR-associated protein Cse1/CasA [Frankia nepalensis]MBL7520805.1 type I-E CRISPR-associated protein Cse1/CasA [Frankia nepalensis]MBL7630163.1 type I-E CRISPR-associated protein Cse1/CasA [Frankia nepalensis]
MTVFDLRVAPWVALVREGRRVEVGVREAVVDAHTFDGLALDDPLEAVAVFRQVLLPVVLDALGAPRGLDEWSALWNAGRFNENQINEYLDSREGLFDLFDAERPFAQVAGLRTAKDETKPVSLLIPRLASGNNVPLFSARTEDAPPALAPAAAARALLAAHCWDTAAIKSGAVGDPRMSAGKTTGNPTGPLGQLGVVLPVGASLFHTLVLNLPIMPLGPRPRDRPQWRTADPASSRWSEREALGLLDLLTWQSRRIRLVPEPDSTTVGRVVVRQVVLSAGDRLTGSVQDLERHTAWRQTEKPRADEPPSRPVRHQPGRAAWRGLEALLATAGPTSARVTAPMALTQLAGLQARGRLPEDLPLRVLTVGVRYGNQSAVIEDVMVDEIPLPVVALVADSAVRETVLTVAEQAERLRVAANRLGDDLRAAGGGDKVPWDKSQRLGDVLVYALTPAVRRLLAGLARHPEDTERAEDAWAVVARRLAWEVAEPALSGAGPGTFLGRHPEQRFAPRLAGAEASFRRALNDIFGPVPVPAATAAS